jgi:hypothetical protein
VTERPTPEDVSLWQKRLAAQANNRAWTLAEMPQRSAGEDEEMLEAAHAAMYFWRIVGTAGNQAHAALLLAHVFALLKIKVPARHYLLKAWPYLAQSDRAPWERAFAHAVAANVASAEGDAELFASHYADARIAAEQIRDLPTRETLDATLRVLSAL